MRCAKYLVATLALGAALAGTFQHGLFGSDECREAGVGVEMMRSGLSAVPTLGGVPFLEKPPLHSWAMALSFDAFGIDEGVARLPALFGGLLAVLCTYLLARRVAGRVAGLLAALALLSMREFAGTSHKAVNDALLIAFVAAGHLAIVTGRSELIAGKRPRGFLWLVPAAGLAFLTKGPIGPILIAAPAVPALLVDRTCLRAALPRLLLWTAVGVLVFGGPWVLALHAAAGNEGVHEALVSNSVGRVLGNAGDVTFHTHDKPFWFYLAAIPVALLPWTLVTPVLLRSGELRPQRRHGGVRFLAFVFLAGVLLLSLPAGKREVYAAPLLPAAAAVVGAWLARATCGVPRPLARGTLRTLATLGGVIGVIGGCGLGWGAVSGSLPVRGLERVPVELTFEIGLGAQIALGAGLVMLASWSRRSAFASLPWRVAAGFAALIIAFHLAVRPMRDTEKDNGPAARQVVALVPADEPLLGLDADEQLRGLVSFVGDRPLTSVATPEEALARLAAGPARHILVRGRSARSLRQAGADRLKVVERVAFPDDDPVLVFRYVPR